MSPVLIALGKLALDTLMKKMHGDPMPDPVQHFVDNIARAKAEFPGDAVIQSLPNDAAGVALLHREIAGAKADGQQALDDIAAIRARIAAEDAAKAKARLD